MLHILEMYELCMNCKKYDEAKTKLDKFQESLTKVRKCIFSECHCWDLAVKRSRVVSHSETLSLSAVL